MKNQRREKVWSERYVFGDVEKDRAICEMAASLGTSELLAVLLYNRGYCDAESAGRFLRFEEAGFYDPYRLADMDKAVERILAAVKENEKICIYGDYDVDGVTSVSMLYLYLSGLGADVCIKIPKREGEGYGVSKAAVEKLSDDGVTLIITVDTGITAGEEVAFGKTLGVDFVVTDHHECRTDLPLAAAVVNPHRPDCEYPFKELAGVGVVFKLVTALEIRRCRDEGKAPMDGVRSVCSRFSDLAALGTIADVMPIVDENRLLVSMGLSAMEKAPREGIRALIEAASAKKNEDGRKKKITSGFVGFGLAPRINAAGRISDAKIAVDMLLEEHPERADIYAEELCTINKQRQLEENRIAEEAYKMIEDLPDIENNPVIVLESNCWQQGIIGIVASKITERYGLPSILISFDGSVGDDESDFDDGKGSGRSIKGLNLVEALSHCDDLLVKYGGHELAAGLTLKRCELDEFYKRINEYAREQLSPDAFKITLEADCELEMKDINIDFAKELARLEPYGTGNATPLFVMRRVQVVKITPTKGGEHLRLLLQKDGVSVTAMYFGVGGTLLGFDVGDTVDLLFNLDINDYKNVLSAQMLVRDVKISFAYAEQLLAEQKKYKEIHGGALFSESEDFIPDRDDCARVYTFLRREYRQENGSLDIRSIMREVNTPSVPVINYVKMKYILDILNELKICSIEEISNDIYRFEVIFRASKTSIEKSSILKKLKLQCKDRIR